MKSLPRLSFILLNCFFIIIYLSPFLTKWGGSFFNILSFTIPVCIVINIYLLFSSYVKDRKKVLVVLVAFLFGLRHIGHNVSFHFMTGEKQGIKVLNYNVHGFNKPPNNDFTLTDTSKTIQMIDWILNSGADIICMQEFYSFSGSEVYNTTERFHAAGYRYHAFKPVIISRTDEILHEFGSIIFSRFPLIGWECLKFNNKSNNEMIYADILIQNDTFRIFNVHLQSFHFSSEKAVKMQLPLSKILKGFEERRRQTILIEELLKKTRNKIILCGDFNETPFNYSYLMTAGYLSNGFERAGMGFGFTYPAKFPLMRIDNIFISPTLQPISFETYRHIKYSDHLPIGVYISKNE